MSNESQVQRLGREGYFDDTKPTKTEHIRKGLENNDKKDTMQMYSDIKNQHYNKINQ